MKFIVKIPSICIFYLTFEIELSFSRKLLEKYRPFQDHLREVVSIYVYIYLYYIVLLCIWSKLRNYIFTGYAYVGGICQQ